jgi:ubiquinone/menaquinone biosynthesis C-methylase UbiE
MVNKYSEGKRFIDKLIPLLENNLLSDLRTKASKEAMKMFDDLKEDNMGIAIGGGPKKHHSKLLNLNISNFKNVDVVADAHFLPYKDESVDMIYCDSVLEHLYDPNKAVLEMFRVLKNGGKIFAITPFLQPYHGYPFHYQNYTITGHKRLFESKGFSIIESGTCVGPTYALVLLNATYLNKYLPSIFKIIAYLYAFIGFGLIKYFDRWINRKENSHFLASSTFVIAKK